MSPPAALPIRLATQCPRQLPRSLYASALSSNRHKRSPPPGRQQCHRRAFSTSPPRTAVQTTAKPSTKQAAQPSIARSQKMQQAQAIASGQFPDDVGLLPDTLILPRNMAERWSWTLRKKWMSTRFFETLSALVFKWWSTSPRPSFQLRALPSIARDLHSKMYKAFASGDLGPTQRYIASGLLSSLRVRLSQRPASTFQLWSITRHLSSPRLVSFKAAQFPAQPGELKTERNAQVQAVVRLHTMQKLQSLRKEARRVRGKLEEVTVAEGPAQEKEAWEYVVLQKVLRKGRWGEWTVWGFADETRVSKLESAKAGRARRERKSA